MNCRNCNTIIDYNYVTDCPQCGCAVEGGDLPKLDPSARPRNKNRVWRYLANLIYVLVTSGVAMVAGAVVMYFSAAFIYIALAPPPSYPGAHNCARGTAIGILSILLGAFLGTVGGAVFGVKHPLPIGKEERATDNAD